MNATTTGTTKSAGVWEDSAGVETLRRMANVDQYNRWIYTQIARYIKGSVLEVGCGIGNMTPFLANADRVTCIDLLPESLELVLESSHGKEGIVSLQADISAWTVERLGSSSFDVVVCITWILSPWRRPPR